MVSAQWHECLRLFRRARGRDHTVHQDAKVCRRPTRRTETSNDEPGSNHCNDVPTPHDGEHLWQELNEPILCKTQVLRVFYGAGVRREVKNKKLQQFNKLTKLIIFGCGRQSDLKINPLTCVFLASFVSFSICPLLLASLPHLLAFESQKYVYFQKYLKLFVKTLLTLAPQEHHLCL